MAPGALIASPALRSETLKPIQVPATAWIPSAADRVTTLDLTVFPLPDSTPIP